MWFKNQEHKYLYVKLLDQAKVKTGEREYMAALYVLAVLPKPVDKYVSLRQVSFDNLFKAAKPWSSSEKALAKLAAALFNSTYWKATIHEIFYSLDADNCLVALEALKMRYQRC